MNRPSLRLALLTLLALLPGALARAQTVSLGRRGPTDGLVLPPTSAATVDDAASGVINPAGLGLMRGFQLEYFHDREELSPSVVGDGVYLGGTLFDSIGLGASLEWIRPTGGVDWPAYRKSHWTLAYSPDRSLSFGVAYNAFASEDPLIASLTSWDVGITARPMEFLSLAASVRDLDTPSYGTLTLPRQYDLSLALRPFGPGYTVAVDYLVLGEQELAAEGLGPANGRLGVTAQLQIIRGLALLLGAGIPLSPGAQATPFSQAQATPLGTTVQAGLSLDLDHVGFIGAVGAGSQAIDPSHGALSLGLRLSAESFASPPAPSAQVAIIDLDDALAPPAQTLMSLVSPDETDPYESLLEGLGEAARDPALAAVILRFGDLAGLGLGKIEELRGAIGRLRAHGKKVLTVLEGGGDAEYYLACAADRVFGIPQADYLLKGFSAQQLFFAEGLAKLGARVDVVRVGAYKDAPDALTRNGPSVEQAEVTRSLLQNAMDRYLAAVTQNRGLAPEGFLQTLGRGISTAAQARADGLLDGIVYPDEIGEEAHKLLGRGVALTADYLARQLHSSRWSQPTEIAIVNVFGLITGGRSSLGPMGLARSAGAATIDQALRDAANDPSVAAVVVRVDSGGGDGEASELIWREIQRTRKSKPVVVSFGDVAASGGYYLAVAGDEILAEPNTVTGSIGVFAVKPDLSGLLQKLGVHATTDALTPHADLQSFTRSWTQDETVTMQRYVDSFYDTFLTRVAEGRKLPKAVVDQLGRGRVWTGSQALDRHLVDGLGSFQDAVAHAKARAHLGKDRAVELVVFGPPHPLLGITSTQASLGVLDRLADEFPGLVPLLALDKGKPLALPELQPRIR